MKKTIVIILLTTVWILLFIVGFNKHRNNVTSVTSIQQSDTTVNKKLLKREDYPSKESFMSAIILKHGREKIEFYGKIVDQNNNPVDKVKVAATVAIPEGWMKESKKMLTTSSDRNGLFLINGVKGDRLEISLQKAGYDRCEGAGTFKFSKMTPQNERHVSDPANPVIFKMWKLKGPEGLVLGDRGTQVPVNGEKVRFDLIKSEDVKEGGDIIISFIQNKESQKESRIQGRFDWTATLEAVDGGFIELDKSNQYDNEAPENGYVPKITITVIANKNWSGCETREMYFKSRNGQVYGKLTWEMYAGHDRPTTLASFTRKLNPNGSRNLEYDEDKELVWDFEINKLKLRRGKDMYGVE